MRKFGFVFTVATMAATLMALFAGVTAMADGSASASLGQASSVAELLLQARPVAPGATRPMAPLSNFG